MSHSITAPLDWSSLSFLVKGQPGQIIKGRDREEDSTRQDNMDSMMWHTEAFPQP